MLMKWLMQVLKVNPPGSEGVKCLKNIASSVIIPEIRTSE